MLKKFMKAALVAAMVCAIGCGAQAADYIVSGGHGGGGGGGAATGGLGAKGGDASEAAFGQEAAAGGNGNSGLLASGSDGIGGLGGKNAGPANAAETTGTGLASGVGGDGGSAVAGTGIVDVADLADYDALSVTGGFGGAPGAAGDSGGNGGKGGKGGAGGAVTVTFTNAAGVEDIEAAIAAARALRVTGGTANNTANGGAGGTATVKLGSAVVAVTDVVLQGGVSGNSDSNAGGKAILSGGTQAVRGQDNKLLVSGNITLTTGVTAGEDVHFGNTGVVDATSKFMDTDLGVIFSGDSTVALTLGNALNVASSFTTSSLEIMAGTESDLNEVTITGIVNTDAKSFSVDATTARTFALGDIALGGYTKLTATGADVSAVVGNLKITGADNTIVNNAASTALVMNAGKTVTFDLAGVTAGQTMLNLGTGGLTGNAAGTNILVDNVSALKYGESVMLVNKATNGTAPFTVGSRKVALATAVDMAADEAGNIYGYKVNFMTAAGAAGVSGTDGLGLRMYKSILVGDDTMTSAVAAQDGDFYTVGGTLTMAEGASYTAATGSTFKANKLLVQGSANTINFNGSAGAGTDVMTAAGAYIGDIEMAKGSKLVVTGTQSATPNATANNFTWGGNLITTNSVTLGGLDLTGKEITANLEADYKGGAIITADASKLTVGADTSVTVLADRSFEGILKDGQDVTVLGAVANINNAAELTDIVVKTEAYDFTGTFDATNGVFINEAYTLSSAYTGEAHVAGLAGAAAMSLVNGGGDAIERAAGSFTPMAIRAGTIGGMQFGAFAAVGAESVETETGSSIDSNNLYFLLGPGLRINSGTARTDVGAFFEAGWGNYDAFDGAFRGEGDSEYYGGGLMFRYENCTGFYAEGSARFGTANVDYVSNANRDFNYNYDSDYAGGHIGLGYIIRPSEAASFDMFAKGFISSMDGVTETVADSNLDIDNSTSIRSQVGAKFAYNLSSAASVFVKGAWEHEFDGEADIRWDGVRVRKSDFGGSSFVGAVGFDVRIAECATLGASIYGVTGQRDGFGGNINLAIGF